MIVTRKIQIRPINKEHYKILEDYLRTCRLIANKSQTLFYVYWQEIMANNLKGKNIDAYFKERYQHSFKQTIYHILRPKHLEIPSRITDDTLNIAYKDFCNDLKNGLLKGERSLRTYNNGWIPVRSQTTKITKQNNKYILEWLKGIKLEVYFGRDKSGNQVVVDRILNGQSKFCDSKFIKKEKKWFLLLCVNEPEKENNLFDDISIGVDCGINIPAVCAVNKGYGRAYIGSSVLLTRFRMQKDQRQRQKNYISSSGMHGRQKVDRAIFKAQDFEHRYMHTFHHKISKEVIKFALKNRASKIIMEDLKRFGQNQEESEEKKKIRRFWGYQQLQSMIEYKAKLENIAVKYIPPAYTSQTCSQCGYTDANNRKQSKFVCLNPKKKCGFEANADYNAALNIAKGGIKKVNNKDV
ncbi:MAG: putative transposase DNA-binding domain protein [Planctomycetes bacterium ADurb.Bin401]|nr:MAG: putative transposase DNA-binding domain protein [Planctomycetes bacterium ADurb.Bin401]